VPSYNFQNDYINENLKTSEISERCAVIRGKSGIEKQKTPGWGPCIVFLFFPLFYHRWQISNKKV
jgi:hypothetical protein